MHCSVVNTKKNGIGYMCLFVLLSPASSALYMSIKTYPRPRVTTCQSKHGPAPLLPACTSWKKNTHTAAEAAVGEESKYKPQDG